MGKDIPVQFYPFLVVLGMPSIVEDHLSFHFCTGNRDHILEFASFSWHVRDVGLEVIHSWSPLLDASVNSWSLDSNNEVAFALAMLICNEPHHLDNSCYGHGHHCCRCWESPYSWMPTWSLLVFLWIAVAIAHSPHCLLMPWLSTWLLFAMNLTACTICYGHSHYHCWCLQFY